MQERLEQLATQARSLAEEVGQLTEAAERGLEAHQLAVLKLHVKLATMPASQQKEEWGRLDGELPASLLTFLPSTEGLGTLGPGQGAPTPPEVEAPPPQQGEQEVVATVAHQGWEGEQQEVQAIIVGWRRLNRGRPPGPKKRDGRGGKREAKGMQEVQAAAPQQGGQEVQEVQANMPHQGGQEVLADTLNAVEVQGAGAPPPDPPVVQGAAGPREELVEEVEQEEAEVLDQVEAEVPDQMDEEMEEVQVVPAREARRGRKKTAGAARKGRKTCISCGHKAASNSVLLQHLACTHFKVQLAATYSAAMEANSCSLCTGHRYSARGRDDAMKKSNMVSHIGGAHKKVLYYTRI